ncbi:MAG: hypothetical protein H5U40_09770 [Polyangiaceae bacterium]|nr:hypothetical protein [Polyangiaceae bacterium]
MSEPREDAASRERGESSVALEAALIVPFLALLVLSWFTVVAPELATERPTRTESSAPPEPSER